MIRLSILGPTELRNHDGVFEHSFLSGPKRLALLAFLVLNSSYGFQRRDKILTLLWPEKGQKSARNLLSNMLYHIRHTLGGDSIISRGTEEISINHDVIWCDARDFEEAVDTEKWMRAIELYRGRLLDGLFIPNVSADFEQWLDLERDKFHRMYTESLEHVALLAEKKRNILKAAEWWGKLAEENPFETRFAENLIRVLAVAGKQNEARQKVRDHANILEKEFGADREEMVRKLTEKLDRYQTETADASSNEKLSVLDKKESASIAVLPFEELGQSAESSNFAKGLHQDLLTRLSGIAGLKVISSTSVLRFNDTQHPISEIVAELGLDFLIEGGLQESGGHMRLHIQVTDTKTGGHALAETYDFELVSSGFFEVQTNLAEKITVALKTKLTPVEKARLTEWTPTESIEAYRLYTMGRWELDQRTEEGMHHSLDYFNQAVELDSDYALAWVGLADALTLLFDYGHESADKTLQKAEEAINRALERDSVLAEAYASLGLLHSNRHEGTKAIHALNKAVELQPSYAEAHNWLSWNYQLLGEAKLALKSARKAVELNPLSPEAVSNLSVSSLYNGLTEEALTEAQRALDLQPKWTTSQFYKGLALYNLERYFEAASVLKNLKVPWAGAGPKATEALCYFASGESEKALGFMDDFLMKGNMFAAGLLCTAMGKTEEGIGYFLKIGYWDDWPTLSIYHLYPEILKPIRKHKHFPEIISKVEKSRGKV